MSPIISLGYYNNDNIGDNVYPVIFPLAFPKYKFVFLDDVKSPYLSDIALLGGGNIGLPHYTKKIRLFKNKYAFSISINQDSDFSELKNYSSLVVRDEKSVELLKEHGIPSTYAPDISILLQPNWLKGQVYLDKLFKERKVNRHKAIIAVIVNSNLLYSPIHERPIRDELRFQRFAYELADLFDNVDASFILIPFSTNLYFDDRISNAWVSHLSKWFKKNVTIFDKLGYQETLDIMSACDCVISTRFHGLIFSFISGVPFIDIYHDNKTKNFLDTIKQGFSHSYYYFDKIACKKDIEYALFNKTLLQRNIKEELERQRNILTKVIGDVDFYQ